MIRSIFHPASAVRNVRGFGLIEAMISTVIVVIGIGTAMLVFVETQRGQNSAKFRGDAYTVQEEMRALLSSEAACRNSFGGLLAKVGASNPVAVLKDASGAPAYVINQNYGDFRRETLTLKSLTLENYRSGGLTSTAQMTLTIAFTTTREETGAQIVPRTMEIRAMVNAANAITSCVALSKMSDGIWQRAPGNVNNLTFMPPAIKPVGGRVGIGVTTPMGGMDVAGPFVTRTTGPVIGAGFSAGPLLSMWGSNNRELLRFQAEAAGAPLTQAVVMRNGNFLNNTATDLGSNLIGFDRYLMAFYTSQKAALTGDRINVFGGTQQLGNERFTISRGDFYVGAACIAGEQCGVSDARVKDHVRPFTAGLGALLEINPVYFRYNGLGGHEKTYVDQLGVIAQDLEKGAPELVSTRPARLHPNDSKLTKVKRVEYAGLIYLAINAVKELHANLTVESEALRADIERLSAENKALKELVCSDHPMADACRQAPGAPVADAR